MRKATIPRWGIQSEKLLALLRSAHGAWVPLPEILALGIAQYNARIFELRKRGLDIQNRTEIVNGVRHSWFRLVDSRDWYERDHGPRPAAALPVADPGPLFRDSNT